MKALVRILIMMPLALQSMPLAASDFTPDQVRATFLYRIVYYARFPDNSLPTNSINFCFLEGSEDTHANFFASSPKKALKRLIARTELDEFSQNQLQFCQVVFVAKEREEEVNSDILTRLQDQTIFVGETMDFLNKGGMLAILPVGAKMNIFLNQKQYSDSSLKFSSDLLKRVKITR